MKFAKVALLIAVLALVSFLVYCDKGTESQLVPPPPARLGLAPTSLVFGPTTTSMAFDVCNQGGGNLNWTATDDKAWISLSPTSGSCVGDTDRVAVTVNRTGLSAGSYAGSISVSSNGGNSSIAVTIEVPATPLLVVSPSALIFDADDTELTFDLSNGGGGTLTWSATDDKDWISISPSSGSTTTETDEVTVTVDRDGLAPGTHTGAVTTTSNGGTATVSVSLTIDPCECSIDNTELDFGPVEIGQSEDRTFTITNVGETPLAGTVSLSDANFSIVSGGGSYNLSSGQTRTVTVRFSPVLPTGTKTCTVETGATCCPDVNCVGEATQTGCSVSPTALHFGDVKVGESKDLDFTISCTGTETISGSVDASCADFAVISGGGSYTLNSGETRHVTVRFSPTSVGNKACDVETGDESCSNLPCDGTGVVDGCSVSPTTLNFGEVEVGQTKDLSFSIENIGTTTLSGTVAITGTYFSLVSGGGSYSLSPGGSRTVIVRFAPTTEGPASFTVETGCGACADVDGSGVGVVKECTVTPTSLAFGAVEVGTSKDLSFAIANTGSMTFSGTVSESHAEFSIVSGGGSYTLSPGASRTVTVRFSPTSVGPKTCTVETGNAVCSDVSCTGEGVTKCCTISPTSISFGNVLIGQTKDLTFTICNCGEIPISGTISESCAPFSIVSGGGTYTLSAGQCRTVTVRFAPTTTGCFNCTIVTGCEDVTVSGCGEGVVCCSVSPTSLNFGNVEVYTSKDMTFTISNCGTLPFSGNVSESNTQYSIVSGAGSYTLNPGQSRTVTVRFAPTSTGTMTCTVETGASACSDVSCTGVGVQTVCTVSPTSLNFGDVQVGSTKDMTFTIRNDGSTTFSGSVSEGCSYYSIVSGGGYYSLSPGQSRTVTVRFYPTTRGSMSCWIETGTSHCEDVYCSGRGVETAFIRFYNFSKEGDGIFASFATNTGWAGYNLTIVEYDIGDMNGSQDVGTGCYDCLQLWQDQIGLHYNYIWVDHTSVVGLPINSSCTSVTIDLTGKLEAYPDYGTNGFFFGTERMTYPDGNTPSSEWEWCETIKTSCIEDRERIYDDYLDPYGGTIIYLWFIEPDSYKDGWACEFKFTFDGWMVATDTDAPTTGKVRVISAKKNPEYLHENLPVENSDR